MNRGRLISPEILKDYPTLEDKAIKHDVLFDSRPSLGSSTLRYAGKTTRVSSRANLLWDKTAVLTNSLQKLDAGLSELKGICYVDNMQAQRLKAASLDDTGAMLTGQVDFNVVLSLPRYQRRTAITVTVPVRAGQAIQPRLFQDSTGCQFSLSEQGLRDHLRLSNVRVIRNFVNSTPIAALIER